MLLVKQNENSFIPISLSELAVECFVKTRLGRPLHPLDYRENFEIIHDLRRNFFFRVNADVKSTMLAVVSAAAAADADAAQRVSAASGPSTVDLPPIRTSRPENQLSEELIASLLSIGVLQRRRLRGQMDACNCMYPLVDLRALDYTRLITDWADYATTTKDADEGENLEAAATAATASTRKIGERPAFGSPVDAAWPISVMSSNQTPGSNNDFGGRGVSPGGSVGGGGGVGSRRPWYLNWPATIGRRRPGSLEASKTSSVFDDDYDGGDDDDVPKLPSLADLRRRLKTRLSPHSPLLSPPPPPDVDAAVGR